MTVNVTLSLAATGPVDLNVTLVNITPLPLNIPNSVAPLGGN